MMKKKAIICDMDGLLIDSERPTRDAWFAVAKQRGFHMDDSIYLQMVGRNIHDSKGLMLRHYGEDFPFSTVVQAVGDHLKSTNSHQHSLKPGVLDLLKELKSMGAKTGVATSTGSKFAPGRLEHVGISSYFDAVSCGDEVTRGKPEPDLFLLAATRLKVEPVNCLVLEDSPYGARGAQKAGMKVIIVQDLIPPPEDVRGFALGVYENMFDAKAAVLRWLES